MKILVLGGTKFLGRAFVERALHAGHELTLFNRGKTGADLFPELETLIGDRDGGLDILQGRNWDTVFDPSGYLPRIVGDSARLLADRVEYYAFVSSISAYAHTREANMGESGPLGTLEDPTTETIEGGSYGPLKVLCEQAAEAAMPGRVLTIRAGLIVGPYDPTDRWAYYVHRATQGGEMLLPESPAYPVQFIDARDIADWTLSMMERRKAGIYNVTGNSMMLGELITTIQRVTNSDASPVYVDSDFIAQHSIQPWVELPMWIPSSEADFAGFQRINVGKALADGLKFRSLETTVRDTLEWLKTRPADASFKQTLTLEKESAALAAWHAR
jgi:2'-hydroxyisoflavone reductase